MGDWNTDWLLEKAQELVFDYGLNIVGALATLIVGWMVARAVKRGMQRFVQRTEFDETLEGFAVNLVYWGTMLMVFIHIPGPCKRAKNGLPGCPGPAKPARAIGTFSTLVRHPPRAPGRSGSRQGRRSRRTPRARSPRGGRSDAPAVP